MPTTNCPTSQNAPNASHADTILTRRRLLQALAVAGGGMAAAALLPIKWTKPAIEVGVLPAHAQVSPPATSTPTPTPTPPPPVYSTVCDSTPGGGDITLNLPAGSGRISAIRPYLVLLSGSGSIENVQVTMTAEPLPSSPPPSFDRALPATVLTDAAGVADFGDLNVSGVANQTSFHLVFSFAVPTGNAPVARCGVYDLH